MEYFKVCEMIVQLCYIEYFVSHTKKMMSMRRGIAFVRSKEMSISDT